MRRERRDWEVVFFGVGVVFVVCFLEFLFERGVEGEESNWEK